VETEGDYHFRDESVSIAAEYVGGIERYGRRNSSDSAMDQATVTNANASTVPNISKQQTQAIPKSTSDIEMDNYSSLDNVLESSSSTRATLEGSRVQAKPRSGGPSPYSPISPIDHDIELLLMKVFVEEMGSWMDTMNSIKYVRQFRLSLTLVKTSNHYLVLSGFAL
jgi:hypothetical protein